MPHARYRATLDELVDLLDLEPLLHRQVRVLSLGDRMRCELAAFLLHGPEVLFLVFDRGTLLFDGDLAALVERHAPWRVIRVTLREAVDPARLAGHGEVVSADRAVVTLRVARERTTEVATRLLADLPVDDVAIEDPPVDDVLRTVFSVVDESGPPAGWTTSDFLAFYAAAAVVWHLSGQHVVWEWDADLRSGDLSTRLLRPLHPFHRYAAGDVGLRVVMLAWLLPTLAVATLLLPGLDYDLSAGRAVLTLAAVPVGYALGILMASTLALIGFWSTQTTNIWMLCGASARSSPAGSRRSS